MSWTEARVNKLKELWGKGQTASQIAEIIGGVSRNAVIGKAHRLNLSSKIKAKSEIFKYNEIDEFISFLNKYSSNSTIILATSKDIGKPGPLIDKLIYEKSNSLHCPLVIINGNLDDKDIEKIIQLNKKDFKICVVCQRPFNWRKKWEKVWNDVKYCSEKCRRSKSKIIKKRQQTYC